MADSAGKRTSSKRSRVAKTVTSNAGQVIKEDYSKARDLALHAAKSGSWLYPLKGIYYFLTHRALWQPFISKLPQYAALYVSVVAGMFSFTYLPQLAVLLFVNGPLAVASTIFLVLNESATLTNIAARQYLLQDAILDTFDGTLLSVNKTAMVRQGREVKAGSGSDPMAKLGKIIRSPFSRFSPRALTRYFLYLPLNFIPVVGTVAFFFFQARARGKGIHDRFFQLKKWSSSQREQWLDDHKGPYTAFGIVAGLLEMIPVASVFFTYTNTVGAALWAADLDAIDAGEGADDQVATAADDVAASVPVADDGTHTPQETGLTEELK